MEKRWWWLVGGMAVLFSLVIGGLQYWKYVHFGYNGLDLGIYSQVVWSLAHGHGFASSIHDPSYLGDHLELGLLPLSWVYRLWPTPLTLLGAQTLIIAVSVWPLSLLAKRFGGWRTAIFASALWLLHPFVYTVSMYEFHGLVFAWPLLFWSILAYERKKIIPWTIALLALLLVREDMPLLVLGWSLFAVIDRRWKWAIAPFMTAVGWFLFAQHLIKTSGFLGDYKYLAFYRFYGQNYAEILSFPFRQPLFFLGKVLGPNNILTTLGLLTGFGLLPLLKPKYLLPVVFTFAQILLLASDPQSILRLHYVIPFLPFLAWASLQAWQDVASIARAWSFDPVLLRPIIGALLIAGPLYIAVTYGPIQWPTQQYSSEGTIQTASLKKALSYVHLNDKVITTFSLIPSLANREHLYSLNYVYLGRRQYTETAYHLPTTIDAAVIDWQQLYFYQFFYRTTLFQEKTGAERIEQMLADNNLRLAYWHDGVAVYRKDGTLSFEPTKTTPVAPLVKELGPVSLLSQPVATVLASDDAHLSRQLSIAGDWFAPKKLDAPLSIRFALQKDGHDMWSTIRLLGQGVHPAIDWLDAESWKTEYRVSIPDNLHGQYSLNMEVVQLEGRFRLDRVRTFRPVIEKTTVHGQVDLGQISL